MKNKLKHRSAPPPAPAAPGRSLGERLPAALPALAVFLGTAAAFWPILSNELVNWDDHKNLLENFHYRGLGAEQLAWMFKGSFGFMGNYEPVHWLTMGLTYALSGMKPRGYHAAALIQHSAAAAAFYFVALRLLAAAQPEAKESPWRLRAAAAAAALLYGLHPLRVEEVAWASGQHYAEAGLYYLCALLAWLRAAERSETGRPAAGAHALALAFFALSLFSLPIGMTLPFTLLILDVYPLRRWTPQDGLFGAKARRLVLETVPYFALAFVGGLIGLWAKSADRMLMPLAKHGLGSRVAISFYGLAYYLGRTLWPVKLYPFHELRGEVAAFSPPFLASYAAVAALFALAAFWRRRSFTAAWAFYFISLLPVLGLTQSGKQVVADRYTYLACLVWPLLAAGAWLQASRLRRGLFAPGLALALAAAVLLGRQTWAYAGKWKNSESLWSYTLGLDPGIALGQNNLGNAYARAGRIDEAMARYEEALRIDPDEIDSHNNMGNALSLKGRPEEAIAHYRRAIALFPGYVKAYNGLGNVLRTQGRLAEAEAEFKKALAIDPDNADAHNNMGIVHITAGRVEEAVAEFETALRINPGFAQAQSNLKVARERPAAPPPASAGDFERGLAAARAGRLEEGISYFRKALAADPGNAALHNNLGVALGKLGRAEEAAQAYRRAVGLNPGYVDPRVNLGIVLAQQGRLDEAAASLREARRLSPDAADVLLNLALVLEHKGEKAEALGLYERILQLQPSNAAAAQRAAALRPAP